MSTFLILFFFVSCEGVGVTGVEVVCLLRYGLYLPFTILTIISIEYYLCLVALFDDICDILNNHTL